MTKWCLGFVVAVCMAPGWAAAQDASGPTETPPAEETTPSAEGGDDAPLQTVTLDEAAARALYEAGSYAFANGQYEVAMNRFREAYDISRRPRLLYNIALCADRLRRDEEAISRYEEFLAAEENPALHDRISQRIALLRANITVEPEAPVHEVEPEVESRPPPDPEERTDSGADPALWVAFGVSLSVAVAGGVMLGVGLDASNRVTSAPDGSRWADLEGAATSGPVLYGAGLAALGVGLVGAALALAWAVAKGDEEDAIALRDRQVFRW